VPVFDPPLPYGGLVLMEKKKKSDFQRKGFGFQHKGIIKYNIYIFSKEGDLFLLMRKKKEKSSKRFNIRQASGKRKIIIFLHFPSSCLGGGGIPNISRKKKGRRDFRNLDTLDRAIQGIQVGLIPDSTVPIAPQGEAGGKPFPSGTVQSRLTAANFLQGRGEP